MVVQSLEQFCEKGTTMTYSSTIVHGHIRDTVYNSESQNLIFTV